jgi:hypothetical protein
LPKLKTNPYSESTRDAIWKSLERLRGVIITLTNRKGKRTLGGILDGAMELDENSSFDLEIFLDRTLIDMVKEGCASLDLEVYFKLPPKEANLYTYLQRQKTFNRYGFLSRVNIEKVYHVAGLGGLNSENKAKSQIRYELREILKKLQKKKIIKKFSIQNDMLQIYSGEKKDDSPDLNQLPEDSSKKRGEKISKKQRCPYGYKFGIDITNYEECGDCELDIACTRASY